MTIHFAYASLPGTGPLARARGKAARLAQLLGLPLSYVGRRDGVDSSAWPPRAPLSITHHVLQRLRAMGEVKFYDFRERVRIRPGAGDILIGHPFDGDRKAVFNTAVQDPGFARRLALVPMHFGLPEYVWALRRELEACDRILGIMGPYWAEHWSRGPFSQWSPKLTPVDMAIDAAHFPRVKKSFNAAGKRKFLFIGNGEPYKGAQLLSILFGRVRGRHSCLWIGADRELPNLEPRPPRSLDPAAAAELARECDVFLTMGVSDANPTTILESMAWGFPVACTPQSGYDRMPEIISLSATDMEHNEAVLDYFQNAPEAELRALADQARALVLSKYTFERFTGTVAAAVAGKGA